MSTVLACDPDALESTARTLRQLAAELDTVATRVSTPTVADWSGLAATEQGARRSEAADLVRSVTPRVEEVAEGVSRVAVAAREEGALVRHHARLAEEAALERARLLAAGTPTDPVAAARRAARLEELGASQRWHESLVAQAQDRFEQVQGAVCAALDRIRAALPQELADLFTLWGAGEDVVQLARAGSALGTSVSTTRRLRRMRGRAGERTLHRVQQRVVKGLDRLEDLRWKLFTKVPRIGPAAEVVSRRAPVMVLVDAVPDTIDGGGYSGWRGGTTRVLAGAAVVGTIGAVVVAAPAAATVGLGAAATYQLWTIGNAVYDNRKEIERAVSRTWRRGSRGVSQFRRRAADGLARLQGGDRATGGATAGPTPRPVAPGTVPVGTTA